MYLFLRNTMGNNNYVNHLLEAVIERISEFYTNYMPLSLRITLEGWGWVEVVAATTIIARSTLTLH